MKIICAVKDLAVQAFGTPFFVNTNAEAIRSFRDEVNGRGNPNSAITAHPEDYEIYKIGEYDEQLGTIQKWDVPELINRALDLLNPKGLQ